MAKPTTIDQYIATFPADIRELLQLFRHTIIIACPQAVETISYGIPAFKFEGVMLAWFGAHTHHIGFYPRGSAIEAFQKELSVYKGAKGSVQFPFDKPLPVELITKIIHFRVAENLQRVALKKGNTKK